ncbi:MAG: acyl-CoA/acyl-ACP dehydrogenase [Pseudomonadales bacterium]|nr:acyl-CoA/acyl-ACP dehydrogenase [Pseudomonadales bacterium]
MKPWKLSRKERKRLLGNGPKIEEVFNSLEAQRTFPRYIHRDVKEAVAIARKFNIEVLKPMVLEVDRKCMADHDYVPEEFIRKAAEWRFYSLFIPKLFGGKGLSFTALYPFIEEIASGCSGLGHLIFIHYLGMGTLMPSFNFRVINKVLKDVCESEKTGAPHLLDLVVTEPSSGTDLQEPLLWSKAKVGSGAEKVNGGYVINGRKIFISNGHLSYWHIVQIPTDKKNLAQTQCQFVIPTGTKGFSFGNKETKMGHLASTASELIFEDCFVSDEDLSMTNESFIGLGKSPEWIGHTFLDYVVSSSRAGVAAISTGMARCAYEKALDYASAKKVNGTLLINHQWVQTHLADMLSNVNTARALYMESAYCNSLAGAFKLLSSSRPLQYFLRYTPEWVFKASNPILDLDLSTKLARKYAYGLYTQEERNASSGWGSLVKISCSDVGVKNSLLAIDIMGADGLRHDMGVEKLLRDSKLQQIYESTNDINRMNMFDCMIARDIPEAVTFGTL